MQDSNRDRYKEAKLTECSFNQTVVVSWKKNWIYRPIFPIDMGFDLDCAKFGVITRDFKVWLLGDFVLEPSENFNLIFLKTDFADYWL